jgi:hypothetical protein
VTVALLFVIALILLIIYCRLTEIARTLSVSSVDVKRLRDEIVNDD